MRRRLFPAATGLAFFLVTAIGPAPVHCQHHMEHPASHRSAAHSPKKLMNWDQTLLGAHIYIGRLPAAMPGSETDTPERIALGKRLYFERGISLNKTKSCHDCHLLTKNRPGTDNTPTSKGATGVFGKRNTPTVINAGYQSMQFWDGRAHNLAEQAKGPILNPIEMAIRTPEDVIALLKKEPDYAEAFRRAFPGDADPMTYDNLAEAIAAFERTLIAPGRFDRMLAGDQGAMNAREKRGLTKFIQYRCVECHTWATVGGRLYAELGRFHPYTDTADLGRYEETKKKEDRLVFKVPMLRNVTRTPPYFSDGKVATLEEAVRLMGWHQRDMRLTRSDIADLIAFLRTLEGNPPPVEEPR